MPTPIGAAFSLLLKQGSSISCCLKLTKSTASRATRKQLTAPTEPTTLTSLVSTGCFSLFLPRQTMNPDIECYWNMRFERCAEALSANNFAVYRADTAEAARAIILHEIMPGIEVRSASWGDSLTMRATGIIEAIRENPAIELIETFIPGQPREAVMENRRRALLCDLFFTGTSALTECGKLVNLDMVGNRTAAITFGPHHVVICVGRNKLVPNVEAAMERIKNYAAPINAIRHSGIKTPCVKTGRCFDCKSPDRICNSWTITEKSWPKHRIRVILINQDLGL